MDTSTKLAAYGIQLCFDGYGAPSEKLEDVALLYHALMELPAKIGMRRVGFPQIIEITESPIEGLSGYTFIMESHISVHTYSKRGFVTIDIYSCKQFDTEKAAEHLKALFAPHESETQVIIRGKRFFAGGEVDSSTEGKS